MTKTINDNFTVDPASLELRKPEFEVYAPPKNFSIYNKDKTVLIRNTFKRPKIDELTDWGMDPESNNAWRLFFNSMAWMSVLTASDSQGAPQKSDWAQLTRCVKLFLDYEQEHTQPEQSDIWDDHATGYRASYISYFVSLGLMDHLDEPSRARLLESIQRHSDILREYLESDRWRLSNHTLFQAEGLTDLAQVFASSQEEKDTLIRCARDEVEAFIDRVVTHKEGSVKEHSIFYHIFLMGRIKDTCDYFASIGYPIKIADPKMFTLMNKFLYDIMPVLNILPGLGDSKHQQQFDKKYISRYSDPALINDNIRHHLSQGKEGTPHKLLEKYPTDGYFIFRSSYPVEKQLYSVLLHKPFRGPHGHWDGMSFMCYSDGEPVFIDSGGPFRYGVQVRFQYFVTQLAHNTIVVNEAPVKLKTKLFDDLSSSQSASVALGTVLHNDCLWVRIYTQNSNKSIIIVDVLTGNATENNARARFHLEPSMGYFPISENNIQILNSAGVKKCTLEFKSFDIHPDIPKLIDSQFAPEDKGVKGNSVNPTKRTQLGLDIDFDRRSYITRQDNKMENGKIHLQPVAINKANISAIHFRKSDSPIFVESNGTSIVMKNADGHVYYQFDFSSMQFARAK